MNGLTTVFRGAAALRLMMLALALTALAPAGAGATEDVKYTKETQAEFEQQLKSGQIESATFNKRVRSMRLTLKNGEQVLVIYKAKQSPQLISKLRAKHVAVTVLSKEQAEKEAKEKPKHHKIRYIVGGVLIAVIVVVAAILIVNRRRQRD